MKKIITLSLIFFITLNCTAQKIVNLVLVGANGVTENIKEASSFIIVKKYPDGFQRLDYKVSAPLVKVRNYTDSTLKILLGNYYEYATDGAIAVWGYYENNAKEKDWYYYNDTGKVILEEKYKNGVLIATINPDTVKKEKPGDDKLQDGEREAVYKKSDKDWIKYLSKNLNGDVASKSVKGGNVVVQFMVNTTGKCVDVHMAKSVEFVLDEEAVRIIENAPLWEPALQKGKKVNAYRRQPITFTKE
jgi:periplasmic protein TonB